MPSATMGRANFSIPFGKLEIASGLVRLGVQGRVLSKLGDAERLEATPKDVAVAFPLKGRLLGRGIGFKLHNGREYYFWTYAEKKILVTLEASGFNVSREARRPVKVWNALP